MKYNNYILFMLCFGLMISSVSALTIDSSAHQSSHVADTDSPSHINRDGSTPSSNNAAGKAKVIIVKKSNSKGCISSSWQWDGTDWVSTPQFVPWTKRMIHGCVPFDMTTRKLIPKPSSPPANSEPRSYSVTAEDIRWHQYRINYKGGKQ